VAELVELLQRQRVHVGAQSDGARPPATQRPHDPGAADAGGDLEPPGTQLIGDQRRGPGLGVGELRMGVDVPADQRDLGREPDDLLDQLHRSVSPRAAGAAGAPTLAYHRRTRPKRPATGTRMTTQGKTVRRKAGADDILVRAACPHDCPDTCALHVLVRDGHAVRVSGDPDHPTTRGTLCTKVARYLERTYHPDRLTVPMRRRCPKGAGEFEPIGWEAAIDEIATRLREIHLRRPEAILPYSFAGTMGWVQREGMASRLFHRLGATRLERGICASAGTTALADTMGASVGMDMESFIDSRLILICGSNSITSNLHFWSIAQEA